jgi:hypothetical protein
MALESGTYVKDLVSTNPPGTDAISQGDDHIRLIKSVLKNSFPSNSNAPIVPDISGNGDKYLQVNSGASATQWVTLDVDALTRITGQLHRSRFERGGATTLNIYPGIYDLDSKGKVVKWSSTLAKSVTVTNGWNYVYLDSSAITAGVDVTASEIIVDATVPTYSASKRGWYNGDDRCIFVFYGESSAIKEFSQNDNYVFYIADIVDLASETTTGWQAHQVTIPPIGPAHGEFTVAIYAAGTDHLGSTFLLRADSGSGHFIGKVEGGEDDKDEDFAISKVRQMTYIDGGVSKVQIYKSGGDPNNFSSIRTNGYYLPDGM